MPAYTFGDFHFDSDSLLLLKSEEEVTLRHQPARLLKHLLETAPGIVSRRKLQEEIWDDGVNVEFDQSLNACVNQLRTALGDKASEAKFVETLPKRGYRFCADFEEITSTSPKRNHRNWATTAAAVICVILVASFVFFGPEKTKPPIIYVAPVKLEFDASNELNDLTEYALRLGVVEQFMRHDFQAIKTINGESLWGKFDGDRTGEGRDYDYVLHISISKENTQYRLDGALIRNDNSAEFSTISVDLPSLRSDELARAAISVANWSADFFDGRPPPSVPALKSEYTTTYYHTMIKARRALRVASPSSLNESANLFDEALLEAPSSRDAMAGKALALAILSGTPGYDAGATYKEAIALADEVEKSGILDARTQLVRGAIFLYRDWDLPSARRAFDQALELSPGDALVHSWRAGVLAAQGEVEAAVASSGNAVAMDPLSMAINSDHCWFLNAADRFEEAIQYCRWALEIDPTHALNRFNLAIALEYSGKTSEAIAALGPIVRSLSNEEKLPSQMTGYLDISDQLRESYCFIANKLEARVNDGSFPNYQFAAISSKCGNHEIVPQYLDIARSSGESGMLFYEVDPRLDEFRGQPEAEKVDARIFVRSLYVPG